MRKRSLVQKSSLLIKSYLTMSVSHINLDCYQKKNIMIKTKTILENKIKKHVISDENFVIQKYYILKYLLMERQ